MGKVKTFSGYCPVHNKNSTVTARLIEMYSTGSLISGYKLEKIIKCSVSDQCPLKKCPVITV